MTSQVFFRAYLFLIVLFITQQSFAERRVAFSVAGSDVAFTLMPELNTTISSNCVAHGKLLKCQASDALATAKHTTLSADKFGRNPGARVCSEVVGGAVVWSRDKQGNERTFCQFKDGTYIGSGTLTFYSQKNLKK